MAKTLVFLPCCRRKKPTGNDECPCVAVDQQCLGNEALERLENGARHWSNTFVPNTATPALGLYVGIIYNAFRDCLPTLERMIEEGVLRIYILAPPYGVVDATHSICDYDLQLQRDVAQYWREHSLDAILAELITTQKPDGVFGYFTGIREWNPNMSMSRHFFTRGARLAKEQVGNNGVWGCFYRQDGPGLVALTALGHVLCDHAATRFAPHFANNMINQHHVQGAVRIGFDPI